MKFRDRIELAERSNLTISGKLVIVLSLVYFLIRFFTFIYITSLSKGASSGEAIAIIFLSLPILIVLIILLGVFIFGIGLIVFWIIDDYCIDWDDVLDFIGTLYKIVFGDYEGKYDFIIEKINHEKT